MNLTLACVFFGAFLGVTMAYYHGNYVPKSFYIIDHYGHKSEPVYLRNKRDIISEPVYQRNKRDIMNNYIRVKRGDSQSSASSSSHASASSGSSSGAGGGGYGGNTGYNQGGGGGGYSAGSSGYIPSFVSPDNFFKELQDMLNFIGSQAGQGGHGQAFASSFSSASSGNGPSYGSGQGGLGSGHDAGYQGSGNIPTLFSRFGEAKGDGIHVSGSAQGQKGAFSSSSSSIDSDGNIKYSVQSGKL